MPAAALAIAAARQQALKDILKTGEKLLGQLTGCKVKPKGTPHAEVWHKAPKYFFAYGDGVPGGNTFKKSARSGGAVFDIATGVWITNVDAVFPLAERRKVEATLRKPCETTTGDFSYYVEVRPASDDRGLVRLYDGQQYAAALYGVDGGNLNSPVELPKVKPIGWLEDNGVAGSERQKAAQAGGLGLGLAFLGLLALRRG